MRFDSHLRLLALAYKRVETLQNWRGCLDGDSDRWRQIIKLGCEVHQRFAIQTGEGFGVVGSWWRAYRYPA